MRALYLAVVSCLAPAMGCSGSDSSEPTECSERSGVYAYRFTETGGDCGPRPNETVEVDEQPTRIPAECTDGHIVYTANNCRADSNMRCPDPTAGVGYYTDTAIIADWDAAGRNASAKMRVMVKNAQADLVCASTYDVVITKL